MTARALRVAGLVLIVAGAVFTLQGIGLLKGSFMTGATLWAVLGPIIAVVGVVLVGRGSRER
jgi:hypothetical protein